MTEISGLEIFPARQVGEGAKSAECPRQTFDGCSFHASHGGGRPVCRYQMIDSVHDRIRYEEGPREGIIIIVEFAENQRLTL